MRARDSQCEERGRGVLPDEPAGGADGARRGDRVHQGDQPQGGLSLSLRSGLGASRAGRWRAAGAHNPWFAGTDDSADAIEDRSASCELVSPMKTIFLAVVLAASASIAVAQSAPRAGVDWPGFRG